MFQFAKPDQAIFLLIVPALLALFFYSWHVKRKALSQFADQSLLPYIASQISAPRFWLKIGLCLSAIVFIILTLARPQGDPETKTVKKRGRDLIFVIDVSRSMLAEDLGPNRLGKARQLVSDIVKILEGDRVGLLVFAGSTAIKCPLTLDYNYFLNALNRIDTQDISRGGTHIGDAIRVVSERLFYDQDNTFKDVILITDGEDHESFPIEAATEAVQNGIKIHTIGLGSPGGSNIPLRDGASHQLLKHNNQIVKTRLDESTLKKIAEITHGVFIPVRTNQVNIEELYLDYIKATDSRETESRQSKVWSELFQFFLAIAIGLFMISTLINEGKMRPEAETPKKFE